MVITRRTLNKGEKEAKETRIIRILFFGLCYVSAILLMMNWYGNVAINDEPDKFYATMSPYFAWLGIVCLIIGQFLLTKLFIKKIDFKIRQGKDKKRSNLLSIEENIQDMENTRNVLLAEKERKIDEFVLKQNETYGRYSEYIDKCIEAYKKKNK